MSTGSVENVNHQPTVETDSESEDEQQGPPSPPPPPANSGRKVNRPDHASDSGYSSITQKTGSSSQSTKPTRQQQPRPTSPPPSKFAALKQKMTGKKPSSPSKKSTKKVAPPPPEPSKTVRRESISRAKTRPSLRRSSIDEGRDEASRMRLNGSPVQARRSQTAVPQHVDRRPKGPPPADNPRTQTIAISKPPPRPSPYAQPMSLQRPHSYHPGQSHAHSVPTHPANPLPPGFGRPVQVPIHPHPHHQQQQQQQFYYQPAPHPSSQHQYHPLHVQQHQPQQQAQPQYVLQQQPQQQQQQLLQQLQPQQHAQFQQIAQFPNQQQAGPQYQTQFQQPQLMSSSLPQQQQPQQQQQQQAPTQVIVLPSGPSSPRSSSVGYNFAPTQFPVSQPAAQAHSYFAVQPLVQSQQAPQVAHHVAHQSWQGSLPSSVPQRRVSISHTTAPYGRSLSGNVPVYPPVPRPSAPATSSYQHHPSYGHGELMARAPSNGSVYSLPQPPRAPLPPPPDDAVFPYDSDEYDESRIYPTRRELDDSRRMPPPPRPHIDRSRTTSDMHARRSSRHSIEVPAPSPRKRSIEGSRPSLSSRASQSSGTSSRHARHDAPPSPRLRRTSRPLSMHEARPEERAIGDAESYIGQTTGRNAISQETVSRALEKGSKSKSSRNGRSETSSSRAGSRSGEKKNKKSSRDHREQIDEETITLRTKGMTFDVKGRGSVTFQQDEDGRTSFQMGGHDESRGGSDNKHTEARSNNGEAEIKRSGRSRSSSSTVPDSVSPAVSSGGPSNSAIERVKKTGSSSRRSSRAPRTRVDPDPIGGIPFV